MSKSLKNKEERIELRVTLEDKRLFEKAAHRQGLSVTSYVVTRALHAAREDAAPYKTYVVSEKDLHLFSRLLENPPSPNAKLKSAARRYQKEIL
jgi:uncharacterized protein (DUF1778 family)